VKKQKICPYDKVTYAVRLIHAGLDMLETAYGKNPEALVASSSDVLKIKDIVTESMNLSFKMLAEGRTKLIDSAREKVTKEYVDRLKSLNIPIPSCGVYGCESQFLVERLEKLQCGHFVCNECSKGIRTTDDDRTELIYKCPLCRHQTHETILPFYVPPAEYYYDSDDEERDPDFDARDYEL
jgi:hypothetical protein